MSFRFGPGAIQPNPYTSLLVESLPPGIEAVSFSWWTAILGRYDVLHVHWPEFLMRAKGVRGRMYPVLFALLLLRTRVQRKPIVRTVHNRAPHETGRRWDAFLQRALDNATAAWIIMAQSTPTPPGGETVAIPHGHYRDRLQVEAKEATGRRVLYFGQIRPYKGVEELVEAFMDTTLPDARLHVVGAVRDPRTRSRLNELAESDGRVSVTLAFVSDLDLQNAILESRLVVLPYRDLLNSGSILLALSLNRPVLIPESPSAVELQDEFGDSWVLTYRGPLDASLIEAALERCEALPADRKVDMSRRDWPALGGRTAAVYAEALTRRAQPRSRARR